MRPAATALTTRVTRMTPSCSSILTSANTAECVLRACLLSSSKWWTSPARCGRRRRAAWRRRSIRRGRVLLADDLAVGERDVVGLCVRQRRIRHFLRQPQQFLAHLVGGRRDRMRHRCRHPRAAFDRRLRQGRVAKLHADILDRQAEHVGRDLRHDRVGAGADVGGRARDLRMAVGGQHDAGGGRHLQRFPDARRHAPADQLAAVAHRARLGLALVPAERLRALAVAFAQLLAGVGKVLVLVAVRVASQPQLQRIELERDGKLVHRAFERVDAGRRARRAHVGGRGNVEPRQLVHVASRWRTCRAGPTSRCRCARTPRIATSWRSPRG